MVSTSRTRRAENGGIEKQKREEEAVEYEKSREESIKENHQRMQSLGIMKLSRKLKPPPKPKTIRPPRPKPSGPPRRSSRIQLLPAVSYSEKRLPILKNAEIVIRYCHQCRTNATSLRSKCCKCRSAQGRLCGDCLFRRYGENVVEANANPDWVCPVCRDICNCNRCRRVKGWEPTGDIYNKALQLGYKSVAHYLSHTHGPQGKQDDMDEEGEQLDEKDDDNMDEGAKRTKNPDCDHHPQGKQELFNVLKTGLVVIGSLVGLVKLVLRSG